jgi:hypothetical protein
MTEGFGERRFNQTKLGRTEAGDECPLCENGTVQITSEVVGRNPRANPSDLQLIRNRETKCMGECGNTAPTHSSIPAGPGYTLGRDETTAHPLAGVAIENLGGDGFSAADLLTVRNLLRAFETHIAQEALRLDVPVGTLCPCSSDEIKAARELLYRLDPLMVL